MQERKNKRNVAYVFDVKDGRQHATSEYLGPGIDLESQVRLRHHLAEAYAGKKPPRLRCYDCRKLLKVRKNRKKGYHFWHASESCIHAGTGPLSRDRLNAIKYNGQKESEAHHELKSKLAYYLEQMEEVDSGNVHLEKHVISDLLEHTYRKPDINFRYKDLKIAMEVQLSTTWLDVILAREQFYRDNKMFVIWVFNSFENDDTKRRAAWNDILFANDSHAYLFDSEAENRSAKTKRLHLKVHYRQYWIDENDELEVDYESDLIDFKEITFDHNEYRHYYKDVKVRKHELEKEIKKREEIWLAERKNKRLEREKLRKQAQIKQEKLREDHRQKETEIDELRDKLKLIKASKSELHSTISKMEMEDYLLHRNEKEINNAYYQLVIEDNDRLRLSYLSKSHLETLVTGIDARKNITDSYDQLESLKEQQLEVGKSVNQFNRNIQYFDNLEATRIDSKEYKIIPYQRNKDTILSEPEKFFFFDNSMTSDLFYKPSIQFIDTPYKVNHQKHKLETGNLIVLYDPSKRLIDYNEKKIMLNDTLKDIKLKIEAMEDLILNRLHYFKMAISEPILNKRNLLEKSILMEKGKIDQIKKQISKKESKLDQLKIEAKDISLRK